MRRKGKLKTIFGFSWDGEKISDAFWRKGHNSMMGLIPSLRWSCRHFPKLMLREKLLLPTWVKSETLVTTTTTPISMQQCLTRWRQKRMFPRRAQTQWRVSWLNTSDPSWRTITCHGGSSSMRVERRAGGSRWLFIHWQGPIWLHRHRQPAQRRRYYLVQLEGLWTRETDWQQRTLTN